MTSTSLENDRSTRADARLEREYRSHKGWLMGVVHRRYGLTAEDCEEIADDILLAWHRKLLTSEGVRSDRAFCRRVLRDRAAERLRRKALPTVELSAAEHLGHDPQLDVLVAERDESRDLQELAAELLGPMEYEIVRLAEEGVGRAELASRLHLSPRQVKRVLEQTRAKLKAGRATLRERGRCGMLEQTIMEIRTGRIGPGDPGWRAGVTHLSRCWICRRDAQNGSGAAG